MLRGRLFLPQYSKAPRAVLICQRDEFAGLGGRTCSVLIVAFGALIAIWVLVLVARRSSVRGITRRRVQCTCPS